MPRPIAEGQDFTAPAKKPTLAPPTLKVKERPRMPSLTDIPKEIEDYAAAKGWQVNFVSADPRLLTQEAVYERFPLMFEDLPKELQATVRRHFPNVDRDNGMLRRVDAVLSYQPLEARDAFRFERETERAQFENYYEHQAQNVGAGAQAFLAQAGGRPGWVDVSKFNDVPIAAHVQGGKDFARAELESEEK